MKHPYNSLNKNKFWATGVKTSYTDDTPKFDLPSLNSIIGENQSVSSVGSCFAQHIGKNLVEYGVNFNTSNLTRVGFESFDLGNVYTSSQLLMWLKVSLNLKTLSENNVYFCGTEYKDYLLPHCSGFSKLSELLENRVAVVNDMRETLKKTDLLIFTLGLTELWKSSEEEILPVCPGVSSGQFDRNRHHFHNLSFKDVSEDLIEIDKLCNELNSSMKILLTVSPVPLTATASEEHILVASMQSKAILRAAVAEHVRKSKISSYFPSYEIITHNQKGDWRFDDNLRTVSAKGVGLVMMHALDNKFEVSINNELEVQCEEQKLETLSQINYCSNKSSIFLIGDSHLGYVGNMLKEKNISFTGGQVMNGSGFALKKFELDAKKIFLPKEDHSSEVVWSNIYSKLNEMTENKIIYTNIGFQMWISVVNAANSVKRLFLEELDIVNYFHSDYKMHLEILQRLGDYGKVCFVEDPNFFGLFSDSKIETKILRQNFHIYANFMRNLANQLGADYLSPCAKVSNYVISKNHSDGLKAVVAEDGIHGTSAYYKKLTSIILDHSKSIN